MMVGIESTQVDQLKEVRFEFDGADCDGTFGEVLQVKDGLVARFC